MTNTERQFERFLTAHDLTAHDALIDSPLNRVELCCELSNYLSTDELVQFMTHVYTCWDLDIDGETFGEFLERDTVA